MKKIGIQLMCLSFAALVSVTSCDKDKDTKPDHTNNNNNNNNNNSNDNNNNVTIVDPGTGYGSIGSATFVYNDQQVTYASVRAKDGRVWLQQNLGAKRVATSATDAEAYGDLYQWGRWADGHQLRTPTPAVAAASTLSANNPSGLPSGGSKNYISNWWSGGSATDSWNATTAASVTAKNGCDPCKVLGNDWRLPTQQDWSSVLAAEGITNNATAFASNLKIPLGGWRVTNTSTIASAGSESWFWSTNATGSGDAIGVWIRGSSVQANYPDARAYGTSVRCVKD